MFSFSLGELCVLFVPLDLHQLYFDGPAGYYPFAFGQKLFTNYTLKQRTFA